MPEYIYRCDPCDGTLSLVHSMMITKRPKCPKCGKVMHRTITDANFILKGSWPGKDIKRGN